MYIDTVYCLVIYLVFDVAAQKQIDENAECKNMKANAIWTCKRIRECPFSKQLQASGQMKRCGFDKLCCPQPINLTKPTVIPTWTKITTKPKTSTTTVSTTAASKRDSGIIAWEKCQQYTSARYVQKEIGDQLLGSVPKYKWELECIGDVEILISGGTRAKEKEFPHMALIGYGERLDRILWSCGGSLISEQYILSAAHCSELGNVGGAKWALLGELERNTKTSNTKPPGLFRIIKHFVHHGYQPPHVDNDIALFKLQDPVVFSPFIRPICLFASHGIPAVLKNSSLVTGWGTTGSGEDVSEFLLKAVINFTPESDCENAYNTDSKLRAGFDPSSMVCAGDKYNGHDTCSGDSGGPLQIPIPEYQCMWAQVGITSYGPTFCGSKKRPIPAIYTKVANYIDWVQNIVWPQN